MGRIMTMARADAQRILSGGGFETALTLVRDTVTTIVNGLAPVHHLAFDTDGQPVNSKVAHVTISEADLLAAGFTVRNTSNEVAMRTVLISFADSAGIVRTYTVKENYADETLGVIVLNLGNYAQ